MFLPGSVIGDQAQVIIWEDGAGESFTYSFAGPISPGIVWLHRRHRLPSIRSV